MVLRRTVAALTSATARAKLNAGCTTEAQHHVLERAARVGRGELLGRCRAASHRPATVPVLRPGAQ
jgi:hypothetical protein